MAKHSFKDESDVFEVRINGSIELGRKLQLESADPFGGEEQVNRRQTVNAAVPWYDRERSVAPYKDVDRRAVEHKLDPVDEPVPMSNQGLVLQYGILGAPGSGKTNLLKHMLRQ